MITFALGFIVGVISTFICALVVSASVASRGEWH